jgi:hypothetical protein
MQLLNPVHIWVYPTVPIFEHALLYTILMATCSFTLIVLQFVAFNDAVVASGLELPGGTTLWRVTSIDGKTSSHVKQDADGVSRWAVVVTFAVVVMVVVVVGVVGVQSW